MIALADNHKMDTHVSHVTSTKDKTQLTERDVFQLQAVPELTKLLESVTPPAAWLAELAHPHISHNQTDNNATDQDQDVTVPRNTLMMVTAALNAQLDKSQTLIDKDASKPPNALEIMRFLDQEETATHANNALEVLFQILREELVLDQSQYAHVLNTTHKICTLASNAQPDLSKIQTTTRDVSQEFATNQTKSSLPKTTAGDVTNAQLDIDQMLPDLHVTESSQHVVALRSMTQAAMFVFHAQLIKLPLTTTKDVSQDNAQDSMKSLATLKDAMLVKNAKRDPLQITSEEDALDTLLLSALANRDSVTMDSDVLIAQLVPDHHLITEPVLPSTATKTRS